MKSSHFFSIWWNRRFSSLFWTWMFRFCVIKNLLHKMIKWKFLMIRVIDFLMFLMKNWVFVWKTNIYKYFTRLFFEYIFQCLNTILPLQYKLYHLEIQFLAPLRCHQIPWKKKRIKLFAASKCFALKAGKTK